ncbi:hypothetical protein EC988_001428 [Linderina pennispora]|nr:hypothetical protein EC988_001428 [Linderina pennispora]
MASGMLVFDVDQASDASKAILEMQALVSGVGEYWDSYVTEFDINMAKSEMRFVSPGHPLLTVVLTPLDTELAAELSEFEVKTLDEL